MSKFVDFMDRIFGVSPKAGVNGNGNGSGSIILIRPGSAAGPAAASSFGPSPSRFYDPDYRQGYRPGYYPEPQSQLSLSSSLSPQYPDSLSPSMQASPSLFAMSATEAEQIANKLDSAVTELSDLVKRDDVSRYVTRRREIILELHSVVIDNLRANAERARGVEARPDAGASTGAGTQPPATTGRGASTSAGTPGSNKEVRSKKRIGTEPL